MRIHLCDPYFVEHKVRVLFFITSKKNCILLRSKQNTRLFFRLQKLPTKTTKISHLLEEKIEKFGV